MNDPRTKLVNCMELHRKSHIRQLYPASCLNSQSKSLPSCTERERKGVNIIINNIDLSKQPTSVWRFSMTVIITEISGMERKITGSLLIFLVVSSQMSLGGELDGGSDTRTSFSNNWIRADFEDLKGSGPPYIMRHRLGIVWRASVSLYMRCRLVIEWWAQGLPLYMRSRVGILWTAQGLPI